MKRMVYLIFFIFIMLGLYKYINQINLQSSEVLQVWVNESDYEVLETVNPIFESMYNVEVQLKIIPSDKVITNLPLYKKSNEYPDIINVSHTLISDLVEMNAIHPMSDIFDSFNILPNVKSAFKVKGEYYGVPYNAQTDILYYNKEMFKYGIQSFSQLFDEDISLAIDYQSIYHINPFVTGFGGYTVGVDNFGDTNFYDIGLNNEDSIRGIAAMFYLLDKSLVYQTEFEVYRSFINQSSDLLIAPASLVSSLLEVYPNLGYQAIPNFVEDILPYTYTKIDTYQITQSSKNQELAAKYLNYLLTEEVAKVRYDLTKGIAPVDYATVISQEEYYNVVKKQLHRSIPLPNQVEFSFVYLPFQRASQQMLRLPYQIETIMNETVDCINSELEKVIK